MPVTEATRHVASWPAQYCEDPGRTDPEVDCEGMDRSRPMGSRERLDLGEGVDDGYPWHPRRMRMNRSIFPVGHRVSNSSNVSAEVNGVSLGGFFYDYLRAEDGRVAGVRYYLMTSMDLDGHPVYSAFLKDQRFVFDLQHAFVDMVFDHGDASALQRGTLSVDVVQDFGGEHVLRSGDALGIGISLPEGT